MAEIANWTAESCTTIGTGDLLLSGSADKSIAVTFAASVPAGTVWYSIQDGINRESGIGTFDGVTTIVRTTIHATKVGGIYDNTSPVGLALSGNSVVSCTFNSQAFNDFNDFMDSITVSELVTTVDDQAIAGVKTFNRQIILADDAELNFRGGNDYLISFGISAADGSIFSPSVGRELTLSPSGFFGALKLSSVDGSPSVGFAQGAAADNLTRRDFVETISSVIATPATATSTGVLGNIAFDSSYFYVCIATNVWVRAPLTTW